ncbi:MAG: hypothetical protein ACOC2U_00890 [bacterium]
MERKRVDFDEEYERGIQLIKTLSADNLKTYKKELAEKINNMYDCAQRPDISVGKKRFFLGLRKIYLRILSEANNSSLTPSEIKKDSPVINKSTDLAKIFMNIAAEELEQKEFDRLYGLAMIKRES